MAKHEILGYFEHRRDGAWVCVRPFTLTTRDASVDIRQGCASTTASVSGASTWPSTSSGWARNSGPEGLPEGLVASPAAPAPVKNVSTRRRTLSPAPRFVVQAPPHCIVKPPSTTRVWPVT